MFFFSSLVGFFLPPTGYRNFSHDIAIITVYIYTIIGSLVSDFQE